MKRFKSLVTNPYFISGWLALIVVSYFYFDRAIADFFYLYRGSTSFILAQKITEYGKGIYYIVPFVILFITAYFLLKNKVLSQYALFLVACSTLPGIISTIIKIILSRPRPLMYFHLEQYGFLFFQTKSTYWSFPSGHATAITGVMVALSLLKPRGGPVFMGFALLISMTRVTTHVHYVSDVMGGMLLGALTTLFIHQLFVKRYSMPPQFDWQLTFNKAL